MASLQDEGNNIAGEGDADVNMELVDMDWSGELTKEDEQTDFELLSLPDLVMDKILNLMTPLDRLRFRMVHPALRSFVADFRAERSPDPWLLLSVKVPISRSWRVSDTETRSVEEQYGVCFALEMETMGWTKVSVPALGPHPESPSPYLGVQVTSAGSSGLVVVWQTPEWPLVVGNLMTRKWHTVAVNPNHQEYLGDPESDHFATHLVLDEKRKETPLKLLLFAATADQIPIPRPDDVEIDVDVVIVSAHAYCFSSEKWDSVKVAVAHPDLIDDNCELYGSTPETICSHDGVVFLLISHVGERTRFMVLAYSEALAEFAVAVPWSTVRDPLIDTQSSFLCLCHAGLTFDPADACPDNSGSCAAAGHETPEERDARNKQDYFIGHSIHRPVWMKQGVAKGLKLVVQCMRRTLPGANMEVGIAETTALTYCPSEKMWEMPSACATASSRRAQLDEVLSDWCQTTFQLGGGTGAAPSSASYTRLWVNHPAHIPAWRSWQQQSSVLVAAYHGAQDRVSSNPDARSQLQVGSYNMDTGLLRMSKAPLPPLNPNQHVPHYPGTESAFWPRDVDIQAFHPSFTDSPTFTQVLDSGNS